MKRQIYIHTLILLAFFLTACTFSADDGAKKESVTEALKTPETDEKTETAEPVEETTVPQVTPVPQEEMATTVSVIEHLASPESVDDGYDWEYHYTDTTLGALRALDTIISGIYMDGLAPYIIEDNPYYGTKMRCYGNVAGNYEALKKVDSRELPEKCSDKQLDKINLHLQSGDGYNDTCCERNGIDDRGGHYVFTQNRNSEMGMAENPVDFLDFPALWLFNEKGKITKRISWARLTGIEKLQGEVTKASKRSPYYPCAYVIDDTMQDGILYFTFTVIDSAGKNKETHAYYYAVLDVDSETMLSCEKIDFGYPKIFGKYLVGITSDYKKIVVQNIKSGKKKKIKNTAGKHILTYTMGGTTVYWMDMDMLYWKDVSSGKTGTQPMNLREAIGNNTLMHNNSDEGWEEVEETIRTESCVRNDVVVSENGNLYGVFWSYAKDVDEIEVCFCDYMVLRFRMAQEPLPAQ